MKNLRPTQIRRALQMLPELEKKKEPVGAVFTDENNVILHVSTQLMSLNFACLNVRGLGSKWKQACFLDDLKAHGIHAMVAAETKLDNQLAFSQLLTDYEKIKFPRQSGGGEV